MGYPETNNGMEQSTYFQIQYTSLFKDYYYYYYYAPRS